MVTDNYKYRAYREIAENREHAEGIINDLKLAYGETAVVPFWYPSIDADPSARTIETLVGTSSLHSGSTVFTCSIENDQKIRNFVFGDVNYGTVSIQEAFGIVNDAISAITGGGTIVDKLSDVSAALGELRSDVSANQREQMSVLSDIRDVLDTRMVSTEVEIK